MGKCRQSGCGWQKAPLESLCMQASITVKTVLLLLLSGWVGFCTPAYLKQWVLWNTGLKMNGWSGCSVVPAAVVDVSWMTEELLKQFLKFSVEPAVLRQRGWSHPCSCLIFNWMLRLGWSSLCSCRQCQALCCYGAAAWSILGCYFTADLIQHNLHLPQWL